MLGSGTGAGPRTALVAGVAGAALAAAVLFAHEPSLTLGLDNARVFLAEMLDASRGWAAGRVAEWSDGYWAGFPVAADPTSAALYLPHAIALALTPFPHLRVFDVAVALHLGLFAAGTARLLGLLGVPPAIALAGGFFALCCPFAHWAGASFFPVLGAMAWWPWTFVAAEQLARPTTPLLGIAMAAGWVAIAAQVLVGTPEHAAYGATVASLWLLTRNAGLPFLGRVWRLAVLGLGAFALSAPQLLPTALYVSSTFRAGRPALPALAALHPENDPLALLFPARNGMGSGPPTFVGAATLLLGVAAASSRRPRAAFLAVTMVLAFVLALGDATPVYAWFSTIPPFGRFRSPIKFAGLMELCVVLLAGIGAARLWHAGHRVWRIVAVVLLVVAGVERTAYVPGELPILARGGTSEHDVPAVLAALEQLRPAQRRGVEPPPLLFDEFSGVADFAGNLPTVFDMSSLSGGIVALLPSSHVRLVASQPQQSRASLDLFGVQFVLVRAPYCADEARRLALVVVQSMPQVCLLMNPSMPRRYAFLERVAPVADPDAMLDAVERRPGDPVPVVAAPGELDAFVGPLPGAHVDVVSYEPGRIALRAWTPRAALLLVRHTWVDGWHVTVDGSAVEPRRAAGLYFAVPVPAGDHAVHVEYRTPGLRAGLALAVTWTAGTLLLLAWCRRRRAPAEPHATASCAPPSPMS